MNRAIVGTLLLAVTGWSPSMGKPPDLSPEERAVIRSLAARATESGFTPGLAVAVVRGDRLVWTAGFGDADRESRRPVTAETRFYIASTSKALTALAAARRAHRGDLDLDAPLSTVFPSAHFSHGIGADSVRVRDLLTHTHGIDGDGPVSIRVAFTGDYRNPELLRLLEAHRPAKTGRAFLYSNLGYDLLGVLLAPETTGGWKQVVATEVTEPLGMMATTAFRSRVPEELLAMPYEIGPAGFERVPLAKEDANLGPAGGHFSTASDLARLVVAELNGGRIDGREQIEAEVIAQTQLRHAEQDREFNSIHRYGWGLGWDLGTYAGDTLVHRFGSFTGFRSHVSFMPGPGLGVVILANGGTASSKAVDATAIAIYDLLRGRPDAATRLDTRLGELRLEIDEARSSIVADRAKRAARSQDLPHPLDAYTGTFANPVWGTLQIARQDGRLSASMGVARSPVEVYDAKANRLRVELLGRGQVMDAIFDEGRNPARAYRFLDAEFTRQGP